MNEDAKPYVITASESDSKLNLSAVEEMSEDEGGRELTTHYCIGSNCFVKLERLPQIKQDVSSEGCEGETMTSSSPPPPPDASEAFQLTFPFSETGRFRDAVFLLSASVRVWMGQTDWGAEAAPCGMKVDLTNKRRSKLWRRINHHQKKLRKNYHKNRRSQNLEQVSFVVIFKGDLTNEAELLESLKHLLQTEEGNEAAARDHSLRMDTLPPVEDASVSTNMALVPPVSCGCKDKEAKAELESRVLFLERSLRRLEDQKSKLRRLEEENSQLRRLEDENLKLRFKNSKLRGLKEENSKLKRLEDENLQLRRLEDENLKLRFKNSQLRGLKKENSKLRQVLRDIGFDIV